MPKTIQDYDEKIDQLLEMVEDADDEADLLKGAAYSLCEDQYQLVIERTKEINHLYLEGDIDDDEYEQYMAYLEEKNNELEEIVVPYMTEAAQAINIALIKTEIKEIEGREGKRILSSKNINLAGKSWMRRRLAMVAKMHPEITPVKELKKRKVNDATKKKIDPNDEYKTIFEYIKKDGKTVFYSFRGGKDPECNISIADAAGLKKAYYSLYHDFLICGTVCRPVKSDMDQILKDWKEQEKKMQKTIKESVLETSEKNSGSIESCFEMVDMAVEEGVLPKNIAAHYKMYAEKVYTESTLLQSLEKQW